MSARQLGVGLVVVVVLACPVRAAPRVPVDSDKLPAGSYSGKLLTTPDSDGTFTVQVWFQNLELKNPNQVPRLSGSLHQDQQVLQVLRVQQHIAQTQRQMAQTQQQIVQAQLQLQQSKKPKVQLDRISRLQKKLLRQERELAGQQLQALAAQQQLSVGVSRELLHSPSSPFKVVTRKQDVDFQAAEDVKVRTLQPAEDFDEKGNIKKYTPEELKKLKGKDRDLPGYESSLDALKPGSLVQLTLASRKKPRPAGKDKEPKKQEDGAKNPEAKKQKDGVKNPDLDTDLPGQKDKEKDRDSGNNKDNNKDLDKDLDRDTPRKKMQVRLIVVVSEEAPPSPGERPASQRGKN